jgi:hypothetical protein
MLRMLGEDYNIIAIRKLKMSWCWQCGGHLAHFQVVFAFMVTFFSGKLPAIYYGKASLHSGNCRKFEERVFQ